jgi:hypothetical protein
MTGPLIAESASRSLLAVPEGWELSALIAIGYAQETPAPPPRRPLARLWKHCAKPAAGEGEPSCGTS